MKLIKTTGMVAIAFGLVALVAGEARAQAPTVGFTVNGTVVNIQWTPVQGATSYDIVVTGTINGQVQLPTTFVQVNAPVGTYNVQVRGRAGNTMGPLSSVSTIVVGGAPAPPPPPPGSCTAHSATAQRHGDRFDRVGGRQLDGRPRRDLRTWCSSAAPRARRRPPSLSPPVRHR